MSTFSQSLLRHNFSADTLQAWIGILLVGLYVLTGQKIKAVYLAPLCSLLVSGLFYRLLEGHWNFAFSKKVFAPFFLCLNIALVSLLANFGSTLLEISGKEILIVFGSILFLTFQSKPSELQIQFLFICFALGFFLTDGNYQRFSIFIKTFNPLFLILPSDGAMEYDLGAALGLFFAFFLLRKKWFWLVLSAIIIVLSGKRVIIVALFASISYSIALKIFQQKFTPRVVYPIVAAFSLTSMFIVEIAVFVQDLFNLNLPISRLLMGRDTSAIPLRNGILSDSLFSLFLGHGPGSANLFLGSIVTWSDGTSALPHNDYLKILYDYGVLGFIALFFLFHRLFLSTPIGVALYLYTLVVFAFDNAFIFVFYLIPLGLMSKIQLPSLIDSRDKDEKDR